MCHGAPRKTADVPLSNQKADNNDFDFDGGIINRLLLNLSNWFFSEDLQDPNCKSSHAPIGGFFFFSSGY